MTWVITEAPKDLKPAEMLVALLLAEHASSDGGHAYPTVETLTNETRLSRRSVQTALRSLEDRGVIEEERGATRRLPAMYCFPVFRGANSAPHKESGAQSLQSGAQKLHVRGANSAPRTVREPSEEPSVPPVVPQKKKTPMTEDWQPIASSVAYAVEWGIPSELVPEVVDDFRAYWLNRPREQRPGWDLTFKNRVRDIADQYRRRARASPNGHVKPEERRPSLPRIEDIMRPYEEERVR